MIVYECIGARKDHWPRLVCLVSVHLYPRFPYMGKYE